MLSRLALLTLLVTLCASVAPSPTHAKGSSYIVAATVSGGTLTSPRTIPIRLPQNLDDMFELEAPSGIDGASLPYALTLHYDFTENQQGKRDWVGGYDGDSTLYFPDSMVVGPGVWAAGWYSAVDELATVLSGAVAASAEPHALPATGTGTSIDGSTYSVIAGAVVLGVALLIIGYKRSRATLLVLTVLSSVMAVSCDDDDSANTPSPGTQQASSDDFRAFAGEIDAALMAGDLAFFEQRMKTIPVDCSTVTNANQEGGTVCATLDSVYDGFTSGHWQAGGGTGPAEGAVGEIERLIDGQLLEAADGYGRGAAQVYALNVQPGAYKVVLSALVERDAPTRVALSMSWVYEDGEWKWESPLIIANGVLAEDFLTASVPNTGYDAWERFNPSSAVRSGLLTFTLDSIWQVNPDSGDIAQLVNPNGDSSHFTSLTFSPDGERMAYIASNREVWVADIDTPANPTMRIDLYTDASVPNSASDWSMEPRAVHWSPDGEWLLVTRQRCCGGGSADIMLVRPDGSERRTLVDASRLPSFPEATWSEDRSPDRRQASIVVVGGVDGLSGVAYDLDGNEISPALPMRALRYGVVARQNPAGEGVLITSALGNPEAFGPIEVIDITGTSRIIGGGCGATWSPDGTVIAYYNGRGVVVQPIAEPNPENAVQIVSNADLFLTSPDSMHEEVCARFSMVWRSGSSFGAQADRPAGEHLTVAKIDVRTESVTQLPLGRDLSLAKWVNPEIIVGYDSDMHAYVALRTDGTFIRTVFPQPDDGTLDAWLSPQRDDTRVMVHWENRDAFSSLNVLTGEWENFAAINGVDTTPEFALDGSMAYRNQQGYSRLVGPEHGAFAEYTDRDTELELVPNAWSPDSRYVLGVESELANGRYSSKTYRVYALRATNSTVWERTLGPNSEVQWAGAGRLFVYEHDAVAEFIELMTRAIAEAERPFDECCVLSFSPNGQFAVIRQGNGAAWEQHCAVIELTTGREIATILPTKADQETVFCGTTSWTEDSSSVLISAGGT